MQNPDPIFTLELFPEIEQLLIDLLKSLSKDDWEKQTLAPQWTVKDIAAHLLDGRLRTLSMLRDNYFAETPETPGNYKSTVHFLNRLNAEWISATKRLSPRVIIALLEDYGPPYIEFLKSLDPFADAVFSVAWAGEKVSRNWFHIAREYTEQWHHQQQIRFAVVQEDQLYSARFYLPYLETSMRALPHHYRSIQSKNKTAIQFTISGAGGGQWFLVADGTKWHLQKERIQSLDSEVNIPGEIAWRIFTKGISKEEAINRSLITGRPDLGHHVFEMLAVMA